MQSNYKANGGLLSRLFKSNSVFEHSNICLKCNRPTTTRYIILNPISVVRYIVYV